MADRKTSDLTALTTPASGDYLPIVDISEAAAASKNKRVTIQSLFQGIPVNVGIGTSSPAAKLHVETIPAAANQSGSVILGPNTDYGLEIRNVIDGAGFPYVELRAPTAGNGPILFFAGGSTERLRIATSGNVGIGTTSPTTLLDVNADTVRVRTARTPASATATGAAGEICWDANYIYVCTATNTWKRAALSTW